MFSTALGNLAGKGFIFTNPNFTFSPPSGTIAVIAFGKVEHTVVSGTGNFNLFDTTGVEINQTGTATGIHRDIYLNTTITAATTTHRPIEVASGDVWIGTTNGKLKIGTIASPQTQFITTGEFGFSGVSPSAAQTGWLITNPTTLRAIDVSTISHANLAEVVGTLLQDLINKGIILA